jgi:phospholipase C
MLKSGQDAVAKTRNTVARTQGAVAPTDAAAAQAEHPVANHGGPGGLRPLAKAAPDGRATRRDFLVHGSSVLLAGAAGTRMLAHAGALRRSRLLTPARPDLVSPSQREALRALGRLSLRQPGSLPDPSLPAGTDTIPQIEHIVVLMMENHSYDNLFGMLGRAPGQRPRGDGFQIAADGYPSATNPYADGSLQRAFHMPTTCQLPGRPTQEWEQSHIQYANGRNDGFVISASGPVSMGYWSRQDIPFTYSLAMQFPVGDRWFCSLLGQTDPNRRYLIAATSMGMTDDVPDPTQDATLLLEPPNGTIFSRLSDANITWAEYAAQYPQATAITMELYPRPDQIYEPSHARPPSDFFSAAAAGKLPSFTLIDPNYDTSSQENPQNIVLGDAFIESIVRALGASPAWEKTLLILTYDEHGGYYDHVPPPAALAPDSIAPVVEPGESAYDGFRRYGFRVPSVVVSPYAKRNHVTHVLHDHTSVLAFVERKWNLPALTYRDANANDISDFLDLRALAARRPTFPELPALAAPGENAATLRCSTTGPGTIPPPAPPAIRPTVRLGSHHFDRRRGRLDLELYTDGPKLSGVELALRHGHRQLARRRLRNLNEAPQLVTLHLSRRARHNTRALLIVRHGDQVLLRRDIPLH